MPISSQINASFIPDQCQFHPRSMPFSSQINASFIPDQCQFHPRSMPVKWSAQSKFDARIMEYMYIPCLGIYTLTDGSTSWILSQVKASQWCKFNQKMALLLTPYQKKHIESQILTMAGYGWPREFHPSSIQVQFRLWLTMADLGNFIQVQSGFNGSSARF